MSITLHAFLPLLVRNILSVERDRTTEGVIYPYQGGCLFADVSGFTALSEKLAGMGREGSEELTRILNEFYGTMVSEILAWDGDIIKFAGDAMTVFFRDPDGQVRAGQCAVRMQQKMNMFVDRESPVGTFSLRMKIGMAYGTCIGSIVGDKTTADFLFAGTSVDESAEAEHHAQAGEIIFYNGHSFQRIGPPEAWSTFPPARDIQLEADLLRRFIPPALIDTLTLEGRSFSNEHRRTVIMFVSFAREQGPTEYDEIEWLQRFYLTCLRITRSYDGYINKIDMGDKGAKIIILFGAPVAHEDDPDRAVMAALDIREAALKEGITTRIGLNYASIFAGLVGSPERCEYTVMGDGVNLAARLMTAVRPNGILCHTVVRKNVRLPFQWHELPAITVKGKADAQPIVEVIGKSEASLTAKELVLFSNRQEELEQLRTFIADTERTGPAVVVLNGPQGIGKTALLAHYFDHYGHKNMYLGTAHDYTRNTPYYPWKHIFRKLLEHVHDSSDSLGGTVKNILQEHAPQLGPYSSLLTNLLGIEALSDMVEATDLETRKNILYKIIETVIRVLGSSEQFTIIIDNYQWLDEPSQGLVTALLLSLDENAPLFIFSGREPITVDVPDRQLLSIALQPFNRTESAQFAAALLRVRDVPPKVLDKLMQMSKGVPLVLQEVLRSFLESGYIEPSSEYSGQLMVNDLALAGIPQTLDGMVMSRFDRLKPHNRRLIRMMSVFGEEVPRELVGEIMGKKDFDSQAVEQSPELAMFIRYNHEQDVITFIQPYFRTVIYESIDFATRRTLHRDLGEICQQSLPDEYIYRDEVLAYHYSLGEDAQAAIPYLTRVVQKSVNNHSYSTAVEQYERLVRFITEVQGPEATAQHQLALIDLLIKLGEFEKSEMILEQMLDCFQNDSAYFAQIAITLGHVFEEQAKFEDALVMYRLGEHRARDKFLKFQCARSIGTVFAKTGNLKQAQQHFQMLLTVNQHFDKSTEYGFALVNLGLTNYHLGQIEIDYFTRSLKIFRAAGDIFNELKVLNNLGMIFERQGAYSKSLSYFTSAYQKASQFGYNHLISLSLSNIGLNNSTILKFSDATQNFEKALMYAQKYNRNTMSWVVAHVNLAEAQTNLANYQRALDLYQKGYALSQELGFSLEQVAIEYGLFLYKIGHRQALADLITTMVGIETEDSPQRFKIAVQFFKAILGSSPGRIEADLTSLFRTTLENRMHMFAYYSTSELFEIHLSIDRVQAAHDLEQIKKLLTKTMSLFNIIYHINAFRYAGTDQQIKRIDALFRKYFWPDYAWKKEVWIGEYYLNQGKKQAARRRIERAVSAVNAILNGLSDQSLKQAICQQKPFGVMISLGQQLGLTDLPTC
ncbi:AAA family ATPase [bacterium]|nr:AAA family ATPase [bacterium]